MVICLFLPRLCYPQISLCPFCHSAVGGGWGSPSGGEQSGVGGGAGMHPLSHLYKMPHTIRPALLFLMFFVQTSGMKLLSGPV